jgi:uncharacterized protein
MTTNAIDARIQSLDVLRGFAVGGILFANILWLSGYLLASRASQTNLLLNHPLDEFFLFFTRLFVHGKFYAVFSFLFGLGFSVQLLRAQAKQKPGFIAQYARRLGILFVIGWAHAWFLWWGDILRFYACLGAVLLLLRNKSDRVLLATALFALIAPVLLAIFYQLGLPQLSDAWQVRYSKSQSLATLAHGGWESFFALNWQGIQHHLLSNIENARVLKIFGLFVLGFYAGRRQIFHNIQGHRQFFRTVLIWGGALGGVASLIRVAQIYDVFPDFKSDTLEECLYLLSVYPLAFAYISGITLACQAKSARRFLRALTPVGQMALSNYLLQTLASALVFYWWGFGLAGALPLRYCYALAVLIFIAQIGLSHSWLKHFNYGPIEWIWRIGTRLAWAPLLRAHAGSQAMSAHNERAD